MDPVILIAEDSKTDSLMIQSMLSDYELKIAENGFEAMEILETEPRIDLVILDLNMPGMDGFKVLEQMNAVPDYKHVVTIILTNNEETESEIQGLDLGAMDFIRKPLNVASLRKRIAIHLKLRNAIKSIEESNAALEIKVAERTRELNATRDITIQALVGLLEIRHIEAGNHALRAQWMMKVLCERLRMSGKFLSQLNDRSIAELFATAPLHDIGKVGIPDAILLKAGPLTIREFEIMKQHTVHGVEAITHRLNVEEAAPFIQTAIAIIGCHHERYDGTGYPKGLKGDQIPLSGRLMAIIDAYDAMTSRRVYRQSMSHEEVLKYIVSERGRHFDPVIVDAFLEAEEDIRQITTQYEHPANLEGSHV